MNSIAEPISPSAEALTSTHRIISIDVFRGLTMILMIFVNELAAIKGLPWWNYHAPAQINVMTYVDMVFPAFLFILGMTIPIALERRLLRNSSLPQISLHVLLRTIALLVLGLILANAEQGDRALMPIGPNLWTILALTGAVLFWNVYPKSKTYLVLFRVLRLSGLALMILMFLIFRRVTHYGTAAWLDPSYPEILGLLGYTYLAVSFLYLATRRWRWAPLAWFVILTGLCVATTGKWIAFPGRLPLYLWPFGNGAMASIAMAGVVTTGIFLPRRKPETAFQQKAFAATLISIAALLSGWLLSPLGISKIRATPTWCLYSIGCSVLLFTLLYWICDVRKKHAWFWFTRPAGENTLLTYLLPDFYFFIVSAIGFSYFESHANFGLLGVLRCVLFTALILMLSALLTRWKLRLHI
jgi:heparan-alpha-glucosaminide N-acetyltransferase